MSHGQHESPHVELHATPANDWRVYGDNLAKEAHHIGASVSDARRLFLCAWENWVDGEREEQEIIYEFLSTCRAMVTMSGDSYLDAILETIAAEAAKSA